MKKVTQKIITVTGAVSAFLMSAGTAFAQTPVNLNPQGQFSQLNAITITSLVSGAITLILTLAALLFFFMLVIGGVQWIVSGGDKAASENARKRITSALVGLAIVFAAWAIGTLINTLFKVNIFTLSIPTLYP